VSENAYPKPRATSRQIPVGIVNDVTKPSASRGTWTAWKSCGIIAALECVCPIAWCVVVVELLLQCQLFLHPLQVMHVFGSRCLCTCLIIYTQHLLYHTKDNTTQHTHTHTHTHSLSLSLSQRPLHASALARWCSMDHWLQGIETV
jgi:hypothetical protein